MQKLTSTVADQSLLHRIVIDPDLDGRFAVTGVYPEQGGVVVELLVIANSDNYVRGEDRQIFLGDHGQLSSTDNYLIED